MATQHIAKAPGKHVKNAGPDRIAPAHAYLFDNQLAEVMDGGEKFTLPFMRDWEEKRLAWWTPDFQGDHAKASAYGYRSAAAWFINLAQDPDIITVAPIEGICADFQKANPEGDEEKAAAGYAFGFYIMRLLWLYGQQLSPAAIVRDVEATIQHYEDFRTGKRRHRISYKESGF